MPNETKHNMSRINESMERKDIADVEKAANDPEAKAEQEEEISYARLIIILLIIIQPTKKPTSLVSATTSVTTLGFAAAETHIFPK